MSLPYVNRNEEVTVSESFVDEYNLKRSIQAVESLLKDAKLLALERDQYALLIIIDAISGKFDLVAKNACPIQHKQKEQYHAL